MGSWGRGFAGGRYYWCNYMVIRQRTEEIGEKLFIEMANRHFNSYLIVVQLN